MPNFDYITNADFRASLESDYEELRKTLEIGAWKSALVLAGSIVEALLVDYLVSTSNPTRSSKDPLKMELAEAIAACKAERVLSDRCADLCSVVRSYRNLIHPARMVRLDEAPPNKSTCGISKALIDLIVDEIADTRRASVGLTAEQVTSKIMRDSGCLTILKHLLADVSDYQRERLLLTVLTTGYFDSLAADETFFEETPNRLAAAFRIVFESVDDSVKERVALEFVRVLKEEDGIRVEQYRKAFFRATDLSYLQGQNLALVKQHILGATPTVHTNASIATAAGLARFLEPGDADDWLDPYIRTLVSAKANENLKEKCRETLTNELLISAPAFDKEIEQRLSEWIDHYKNQGNDRCTELVTTLHNEVRAFSIPF